VSNEKLDNTARILSHGGAALPFEQKLAEKRREISERGDLADATIKEQLDLLDQLVEFPFGRFLLEHRGWNGCWTDFVMEYPERGRENGTAPDGRCLTDLERQILDTFPTVLATQERSRHFASIIQEHLVNGAVLASIPCGLMRDLLGRDFNALSNVQLVGIDIDTESLSGATCLADQYGLSGSATFLQKDAWELGFHGEFDLIASNGLNIYEPDDGRVTDLYRCFFTALRPGGVLVTSFLTPPPTIDPTSEWNMTAIDPKALRLQRLIFVDIVAATFQCYRNSSVTNTQLREAGFWACDVIWDQARMFPTVVARKASQ
jgi:SAM-dependent methyltransferase